MAFDRLGSAPEAAPAAPARATPAPETVGVQQEVARKVSVLADAEQAAARREASALLGNDVPASAPADAPQAPAAPFDAAAFDKKFEDDYPDYVGLGAIMAPKAATNPALARFLASDKVSAILDKGGNVQAVAAALVQEAKSFVLSVSSEVVTEKQTVSTEKQASLDGKSETMSAEFEKLKTALGKEKFEAVQKAAQEKVAAHPEAFKGVGADDVLCAYFVANAANIGAGLSGDAKAQFESSVKNLDRSQDAAFQKLVANLSSPREKQAAQEIYEKAKKEGKMTVIDEKGERLVIADADGKDAQPEVLTARNGALDRRMGGEKGVRVHPPESADRARYAKDMAQWLGNLPRVGGIIPASTLQGMLERLAANPNTPLFQKYGQPPYDPDRGFDPYNKRIAARLLEDVFHEKLFTSAESFDFRAADGRDLGAHLALEWQNLQNRISAGGQSVLFKHLAFPWRHPEGGEDGPSAAPKLAPTRVPPPKGPTNRTAVAAPATEPENN